MRMATKNINGPKEVHQHVGLSGHLLKRKHVHSETKMNFTFNIKKTYLSLFLTSNRNFDHINSLK